MKIVERNYSSKIYRPKPVVYIDNDGKFLIIATSWGNPEHAQKVIDEYQRYISAARMDVEVTSPFQYLTCYPPEVNYLRIATLITNEIMYRRENQGEYLAGLEVLALIQNKKMLSWVQVGGPSLLIQKPNLGFVPILVNQDMGKDFNTITPLPSFLLGADRMCDMKLGHCKIEKDDVLVALSSTILPMSTLTLQNQKLDLDLITSSVIQYYPNMPFWTGIITAE